MRDKQKRAPVLARVTQENFLAKHFQFPIWMKTTQLKFMRYASLRPQGFWEPNDPVYIATRTIPLR